MKLKEIKPGMVIHCKNDEEKKLLLEEAERLGYVWCGSMKNPTKRPIESTGNTIHFNDADKSFLSAGRINITHSTHIGDNVIEFSDLILPELTAEEALKISGALCTNLECRDCPVSQYNNGKNINCRRLFAQETETAVELIAQWKSDHEKKEPEIETVDICRIIEVQPDGRKRCVHEEDIKPDSELPYGYERDSVNEILKRYCMEHDGEFIAVHEVVCRVKAVE